MTTPLDLDAIEARARRSASILGSDRSDVLALVAALRGAWEERDAAREAICELLEIADLSPASGIKPDDKCEPAFGAMLCGHEDCEKIGCVMDKIARARAALGST